MSKVINIFFFLLSCTLISCAQGKHGIRKIEAYVTERLPGNIPVNQQGEPLPIKPDTSYIIYVVGLRDIGWDTAWLDGKQFIIHTTRITELPFQAGTEKNTGKEIMLSPTGDDRLWQLTMEPVPGSAKPPETVREGELLLRGRAGETIFYKKVENIKVLVTTNSV